jgi:hypothetical protein
MPSFLFGILHLENTYLCTSLPSKVQLSLSFESYLGENMYHYTVFGKLTDRYCCSAVRSDKDEFYCIRKHSPVYQLFAPQGTHWKLQRLFILKLPKIILVLLCCAVQYRVVLHTVSTSEFPWERLYGCNQKEGMLKEIRIVSSRLQHKVPLTAT